jgi:malonyl-CoA O-methyltransferase
MQIVNEHFHKKRIAECFNKVAASYDANATLQQFAGKNLLQQLIQANLSLDTILDLGSGTGFFADALKKSFPTATYIAVDIADQMLAVSPILKDQWRVLSDFDALPISNESIDLIFSNMALQWSLDIATTLSEWRKVLRPKGLVAFSILSTNSFMDLRNSCHSLPRQINLNSFVTQNEIEKILASTELQPIYLATENFTLEFSNLMQLLKHFKKIGTNYLFRRNSKSLFPRNVFLEFERNYENLRTAQNTLPINYEIIYCLARKTS